MDIDLVLGQPLRSQVAPEAFIRAAMRWHFSPETGSPFWLRRAATLEFDPLVDVTTFDDLRLFPNVADELRDVPVEDLLPAGADPAELDCMFESGGTTGAPKRVLFLREWTTAVTAIVSDRLDTVGFPTSGNWLTAVPTGPHMIGELGRRLAEARGGIRFSVDMDPRWVKRLMAAGRVAEAEAYAEHLVDQAATVLRTQQVGVLMTTPPLLERMARRDDLVELIAERVGGILWGGAHLDDDTRHLLRTEVFPKTSLYGAYGSTMILGGAPERIGLGDDEPCVFDPPEPYVTFRVVDPATGERVAMGERGQVVMNHISRALLLVNNLERDSAVRVPGPDGCVGDSVAGVRPVQVFGDSVVIEGVY